MPASRGTPESLRQARSCYDHLAGALAVALLRALERNRLLSLQAKDYRLSDKGEQALADFGLDLGRMRGARQAGKYAQEHDGEQPAHGRLRWWTWLAA